MEPDAPRKPGVARIVLGILAIHPLSVTIATAPGAFARAAGADAAPSGAVLAASGLLAALVFGAGVYAIVTGVRNRRRHARAVPAPPVDPTTRATGDASVRVAPRPGVARIVLGTLAIFPLSLAVGIMPFVIFVFGGGGWDAFVAQNGAALVVFPILGAAVLIAGIVMVVTGVRNRRAWHRAHRPVWAG